MEAPPGTKGEALNKFNASKSVIRIRTINVIKKWIELQSQDFKDEEVSQLLECFLKVS